MKLAAIVPAAALAATLLCGTAHQALAQSESVITGGFDVGPGGLPGNFNPLAATAGFTWLNLYFEPLVIYDAKLETVVGALAERFEVDPAQTTYTFHLADARWHDGQPFTSADVAFTIALVRNSASGSVMAGRLASVTAVETPDPHTAVIRLSAPSAGVMDTLTKVMMLPQHALAAIPVADLARHPWWSTTPIGTGPFRFSRYVNGQYVALTANADYRGGKPKADRVVNRYFETTAGAVAALRSGEIQFSYVETDDAATFRNDAAFRVIEGNSFVVNYIGFNQEVPQFKDQRVRAAVMHAIDRAAIIKSLYGGAATVANCGYVAPAVVPGGIDPYAFDPERARTLLREAGWGRLNGDKPIPLLTYYNNPLIANVLAAMQAQLADVGINVVPRAIDVPTYNSIVYSSKPDFSQFPLVFGGLQNGPDPSTLNAGLNVSQMPPAGANYMRINMPPVSAAFDAAGAETDPARRVARYGDVCRAMNANLPWGTMWVTNRYGVASTRLHDFVWTPAPAGGPFEAHPERWSLSR